MANDVQPFYLKSQMYCVSSEALVYHRKAGSQRVLQVPCKGLGLMKTQTAENSNCWVVFDFFFLTAEEPWMCVVLVELCRSSRACDTLGRKIREGRKEIFGSPNELETSWVQQFCGALRQVRTAWLQT